MGAPGHVTILFTKGHSTSAKFGEQSVVSSPVGQECGEYLQETENIKILRKPEMRKAYAKPWSFFGFPLSKELQFPLGKYCFSIVFRLCRKVNQKAMSLTGRDTN